MIVVRVTLKTCCFPFLLTCSICFWQTVSPHIFGTKLNHASTQERSNYIPKKLSLASNQWLYLQTFCKRGQGLVDGLGSCWTPNTRLTIWFLPHKEHNQPLFILRHILATAKKKKRKVFTAFLDLLAAYDSIPRKKLLSTRRSTLVLGGEYNRTLVSTLLAQLALC